MKPLPPPGTPRRNIAFVVLTMLTALFVVLGISAVVHATHGQTKFPVMPLATGTLGFLGVWRWVLRWRRKEGGSTDPDA